MKKLFFESENAERCYSESYFQDYMKNKGLIQMTLWEANKIKIDGFFYCKAVDEMGARPPEGEPCGKWCKMYEPRNGKSGCCKSYSNTLFECGEEITLKLKK